MLSVVLSVPAKTFASYEITKECEMALLEILNLHLKNASEILYQEKLKSPENYFIDYLENYKDMVEILILEDKSSYEKYLGKFNSRLDKMEEKNPTTPYYRVVRAEMMAQTGLLNVLNGDEIAGFVKIFKANKLLKKNLKEYPEFYLNKKLYGVFNVAFDNIPPVVKWATNMLGLVGSTDDGFNYLRTYKKEMEGRPGMYSESLVYLVFAYKIVSDDQGAYEMLKKDYVSSISTALGTYLYALVLYRNGRNEESLELLYSLNIEEMEVMFYPIIQLIARDKLNRLDTDADKYWLTYLENSKNENYKKETCNKLSLHYLVHNNKNKYMFYRNLVTTYDKAVLNEDREADVDILRPYPFNVDLLKVHFLVSGSYFDRANSILDEFDLDRDPNQASKIQYYLLKGKILSKIGGYDEAMALFNKAIDKGVKIPEHYTAEAALMAGNLALENENYPVAWDYYKLCQDINCDDNIYREAIRKNAKTQLRKLKHLYPQPLSFHY